MAGAYSDQELRRLDEIGERRTAEARLDIRQRHLTEFVPNSAE